LTTAPSDGTVRGRFEEETAMARLGVTKEDVWAACEALQGRGVTATVANVRAELGTGSYTTLLPLIQDFNEEAKRGAAGSQSQDRPPEAPSALAELSGGFLGQLWAQAWQEAQAVFLEREKKWKMEQEEGARALAQQSEALTQAVTDLKRLEAEEARLQAECADAQASLHKKDAELALLRQTLSTRETELKTTLERAVVAETTLAAKNEELGRVQSESQRFKSDGEALRRDLTASQGNELKKDGEIAVLKRPTEIKELLKRAHTAEERFAQSEARKKTEK
jgi:hypothetical protein